MGHPSDIRQCSNENHRINPCSITTAACTAVSNGRCASNGVCCNPGKNFVDEKPLSFECLVCRILSNR